MQAKLLYVAGAVLSLAVVSTVAIAKRFSEVEYTYMDAKGNMVGGKIYHCAGSVSQWGVATANYDKASSPCD